MGQILTIDTTSQLRLISIDAFSSVVGKNDIVVDLGIGLFETVSLISIIAALISLGKPGTQNVNYQVSSDSLDYGKLLRAFNFTDDETSNLKLEL